LIRPKFIGHQLGESPADTEVKEAEVTDDDPREGKDAKAIYTQAANHRGYGDQGHQHWDELTQQVPYGIVSQKPAAG
jgi:hypothetical protein